MDFSAYGSGGMATQMPVRTGRADGSSEAECAGKALLSSPASSSNISRRLILIAFRCTMRAGLVHMSLINALLPAVEDGTKASRAKTRAQCPGRIARPQPAHINHLR
jgi:hypothetical protein